MMALSAMPGDVGVPLGDVGPAKAGSALTAF
jgi:hypothetical protein